MRTVREPVGRPLLSAAAAVGVTVAVVLALLFLAGCGANDASVAGRDTGPGFKINMPNHFGTVARKCDGPNMIYETENGNSPGKGAFAVVAGDPRCKAPGTGG